MLLTLIIITCLGSHLEAVSFSDSGYAEYFDLYGLPPLKLEIMAYLQRHSISWTFNRHRLQGFTSNVCGHFCCLYALHRARGLSMTSFVNMFIPARYTCNDKKAVRMFRAQFRVCPTGSRLEEQESCTNINKVCTHFFYQSTMSLLVIDFTFLEGRDGELVVKELAVVDSHSNRV